MKKVLAKLNLAKLICTHLFGKKHTHGHRMTVGIVFMFLGMWVSHLLIGHEIAHIVCELSCDVFKGFGLVPFIDYVAAAEEL